MALSTVMLASCSSVKYLAIEQLVPSSFFFASDATRVGVLNNFSEHNVYAMSDDFNAYSCNGDTLMESVAQAFADEGVFGEVVVLDSCLYPAKDTVQHVLSRSEVKRLCDMLDVDILYVCDYGGITFYPPEDYRRTRMFYLVSRLYAPTRDTPMHTFVLHGDMKDGTFHNEKDARKAMLSTYPAIGALATHRFAPSWETRERSFYATRHYEMREATVCVREGDWECAVAHWRKYGERKKQRCKFMAAYNEALYYEMTDSLDKALENLDRSLLYVKSTEALDSTRVRDWLNAYGDLDGYPFTDNQRVTYYRETLKKREKEIQQLIILQQQ